MFQNFSILNFSSPFFSTFSTTNMHHLGRSTLPDLRHGEHRPTIRFHGTLCLHRGVNQKLPCANQIVPRNSSRTSNRRFQLSAQQATSHDHLRQKRVHQSLQRKRRSDYGVEVCSRQVRTQILLERGFPSIPVPLRREIRVF